MKTILIIDDEDGIRSSLSAILKDEGYSVISEASGEAGLKAFTEKMPNAVLLDVWLPDGDGADILKEMAKINKNIPVIMISGHSDIDTAIKTIKLGAYDFIEKPLSLDRLVITVENAVKFNSLSEKKTILAESLPQAFEFIGETESIRALKEKIIKAAPSSAPVLITGENGTGKEIAARAVHLNSLRNGEPFVAINCAAIPEELIESEIFGYEKGAFTGANARKKGKFELADGGTIFLDEIGDMSLRMQSKILRVLQEGKFQRVGGESEIESDVRVIAATNKDLEEEIKAGRFRSDLFFRLNVIPLYIPPLRERKSDIPLLTGHFIKIFGGNAGRLEIDESAMDVLKNYGWPGNVRELKNIIERFSILNLHNKITAQDVISELKIKYPGEAENNGAGTAGAADGVAVSYNVIANPEKVIANPEKVIANPDKVIASEAKQSQANDSSPQNILTPGNINDFESFMSAGSFKQAKEEFERAYLIRKLKENGNNVTKTALILGMSRRNLQKRINCLNINQ
ncbi:MAG: sigma-54 dependent transcriptional regulator [Deltaproteobacteria bacterium]|nr:sigma-54 dependent transcriptional regulator [Deltaproteobacteria bacterium]